MAKRWQGILDALVGANGLAGFDGLTVHYVRLQLDHFVRRAAFDLEVQVAHQLSGHDTRGSNISKGHKKIEQWLLF